MPKLALSRRHRRQNNLLQFWNSPIVASSEDGSEERHGGLVRATARMVSDEDMHQSSAAPLSPQEHSSSETSPVGSSETNSVRRKALHFFEPEKQALLKRPSPSMCLTDLVAASYGTHSIPSPRQRPRFAAPFDSPGNSFGLSAAHLLNLSPLCVSPPSAPSSPKSEPVSPNSPWGHFVDLVPHELEGASVNNNVKVEQREQFSGGGSPVSEPFTVSSGARRQRPSTPRSGYLPTCPQPRSSPHSRPVRCELESPYESALLRRRPGRFCFVPPDYPAQAKGAVSGPSTTGSSPFSSVESLPGFVLSTPRTAASSTRLGGCMNPHEHDSDLRLLMEDARVQFDSLAMDP